MSHLGGERGSLRQPGYIVTVSRFTTRTNPQATLENLQMADFAKLETKYRALKERATQLERERDDAEEREQRLRDTLEEEISRALVRRSKSLTEKVKAAEASASRARKEGNMLRKELADTHEMFKAKLNKERDTKMTEVTKSNQAGAQLESAKKLISRLKATLASVEAEFAEEKSAAESLLEQAEAELRLNSAKMEELVSAQKEELLREKEARFASDAKRRSALHKLKSAREELLEARSGNEKTEQRYTDLCAKLEKAVTQSKQRLSMVKAAQNTSKALQEQFQKNLVQKEKDFKTELLKIKAKLSVAEADKGRVVEQLEDLKCSVQTAAEKDETFRRERTQIETERDEARASIVKYIELGERCQREVAIAEDKIIVMQGKLEDRRKWCQEQDLKIDELEGKLAVQEIKYAEMKEKFEEKSDHYNDLKTALASRGISLAFVLQSGASAGKSEDNSQKRKPNHMKYGGSPNLMRRGASPTATCQPIATNAITSNTRRR